MKSLISLIFSVLIFIGCIDIILTTITFFDLFSVQTRGTEWYKLSNDALNSRFFNATIMIIFSIIYFKYIEPKIPVKNKSSKPEYTICPKCKETFTYSELENGKCKYCEDIDTIDIE